MAKIFQFSHVHIAARNAMLILWTSVSVTRSAVRIIATHAERPRSVHMINAAISLPTNSEPDGMDLVLNPDHPPT